MMSLLYIIHVVPFDKWTRATGTWTSPVKKLVRVRVGTKIVGTMTGRGRELADLM